MIICSENNPGKYERYKPFTGLDEPVIRFLEEDGEIAVFLEGKKASELLECEKTQFYQRLAFAFTIPTRSEEHTSELQSPEAISYAVFCLKHSHPSDNLCKLCFGQ